MRAPLFLIGLVVAASTAGAEIAVLENGQTLKIDGHRTEADLLVLSLRGGGEVGVPPEMVRGLVPDEVVDEVVRGEGDLRSLARAVAERHGLDPELVMAVVGVESGFETRAVSPKGARGLMQLMPGTARELGVVDAFDAEANLDGGSRYLQALLRRYGGDLRRALAAYNAGPGAVARHGGVPPYRETRDYVRKVMRRYGAKAAAPMRGVQP
jgi:soluble lytic murein transglycosylase-like protein